MLRAIAKYILCCWEISSPKYRRNWKLAISLAPLSSSLNSHPFVEKFKNKLWYFLNLNFLMSFDLFCDIYSDGSQPKHVLTPAVIIIINGAARDFILCQDGNAHKHVNVIWKNLLFKMVILFNLFVNSEVCVRILSQVCVSIISLPIYNALFLCKLKPLWPWGWIQFHASVFLNGNERKGLEQGTADNLCLSVGWLISFVVFSKSWLSPYWSVRVTLHTAYSPFWIFNIKARDEVELGMQTQHEVVVFLIFLFVLHQQWTCISLSKEIIKHPFATCPGHHSCLLSFITIIHKLMVILADELILHTNQSIRLDLFLLLCNL